jgi:glutathione S-transferase
MGPIQPGMIWIGWITLAALVLYLAMAIYVSRARARDGVNPPTMSGPPAFECAVRVHANTLEHLVPFLVALWMCAIFWAPLPAAILGVVWLFGRVIYAFGYYSAPGRRIPGFVIAMIALVLLIIGAAYGLIRMGIVMGV